uniref:Uncharacterized protein n=1 Tax=Pipistrellus kuhlii TaxID=59472 RepID=A0A7J8B2C1_PIPKU|nr:hypothetical protein mPipKuh1_007719 [Pipistrellus kuhlii]
MTTLGHSMMPQTHKKDMNRELKALLEDQAKKNNDFGGKEAREAEELAPGDSPVVDNEGGNSPPSNLHDRAMGEAIAKMPDKYKGGTERPLTKRRKLIMEATLTWKPFPRSRETATGSGRSQWRRFMINMKSH